MRTLFNAIVLVGLVGAALLAPQQASARTDCSNEYYLCLAAGNPGYICRGNPPTFNSLQKWSYAASV